MVRIELLELAEDYAKYKFFPENSESFGIVSLNRKTGERMIEKIVEDYDNKYAFHALYRIEQYQKKGEFLEKDLVAWY